LYLLLIVTLYKRVMKNKFAAYEEVMKIAKGYEHEKEAFHSTLSGERLI